jgi:vacuolar-type H+-ATPase subunit H
VPLVVSAQAPRQDVQSAVDGGPIAVGFAGGGTEAIPIDIIFLIEQLERVVASGRSMPLTSNVIIDQARALDLLDQLREAVPEEVRAAKRINEETERIVERAQEEAERILARAQEQAAFLIEERELTRAAEIKSQEIIAAGEREADEIRRGADEYAQSVLVKLEGECVRALQSIKRGLALLDDRQVADEVYQPDAGQIETDGDGMPVARQREKTGAQL